MSPGNLSSRPIHHSIEGEEHKDISYLAEGMLAFDNYEFLSSWIHPQVKGFRAIHRVVLEKFVYKQINTVDEMKNFFKHAVSENANRAHRNEKLLSHRELHDNWDQFSSGGNPNKTHSEMAREVQKLKKEMETLKAQKR